METGTLMSQPKRTNGIGEIKTTAKLKQTGTRKRKEVVLYEEHVMLKSLQKIEGAPANVGTTRGLTMNLGDFESCRIDVWLNVPCTADPEVIEETFKNAEEWVNEKIGAQRALIRQARQDGKI